MKAKVCARERVYAYQAGRGHEGEGACMWVIACMLDKVGHEGEGGSGGTCMHESVHEGVVTCVDVCLHVIDEGQGMGKGVGEMAWAFIARASPGQARVWAGGAGIRIRLCTCAAGKTSMRVRARVG